MYVATTTYRPAEYPELKEDWIIMRCENLINLQKNHEDFGKIFNMPKNAISFIKLSIHYLILDIAKTPKNSDFCENKHKNARFSCFSMQTSCFKLPPFLLKPISVKVKNTVAETLKTLACTTVCVCAALKSTSLKLLKNTKNNNSNILSNNIIMSFAINLHTYYVECNHTISFVIMQSIYMLTMSFAINLHNRSCFYE